MDISPLGLDTLNLSPLLDAPIRNMVPGLVCAANGHEMRTVMVAGKVLVRDGGVLTADEDAVHAEAQADPVHKGMALLEAMAAGWL